MSKGRVLKNISLIIALVVVVYLVANYTGLVQSTIMQFLNMPGSSVAGASTQRAQDISDKISNDISGQVGVTEEKILNIKVSDVITGFMRIKKIPRDFESLKEYSQEQIENMLQSKK